MAGVYFYNADKETISKEELGVLLKNIKKEYTGWACKDCPLSCLSIKERLGCIKTVFLLCGIKPTSCSEALKFLYEFSIKYKKLLNKNKQNKI